MDSPLLLAVIVGLGVALLAAALGIGAASSLLGIGAAALIVWACRTGMVPWGKPRGRARADELSDDVMTFVSGISNAGTLPTVEALNVHLEPGEFAVLHDIGAVLFELRRTRAGHGVGTRIRIARVPLYVGAWESAPVEHLNAAAEGDLYLTNHRLVFTGGMRTVAVLWKNLLTVDGDLELVRVGTTRTKTPLLWRVSNPLLWALMIRWMSQVEPKTPTLPRAMTLGVRFQDDTEGHRQILLTGTQHDLAGPTSP